MRVMQIVVYINVVEFLYLLSGLECKFVVLSPVFGTNLLKVKRLREKIVDKRTKGHAVCP